MKKIIIIVIALMFAAAGGALWLMGREKPIEPSTSVSEPVSEPEVSSEPSVQIEVNMGSGGGEIPLDENGDYIGGTGEDPAVSEEQPSEPETSSEPEPSIAPEVTPEPKPSTTPEVTPEPIIPNEPSTSNGYSSLDEIDTSKLNIGDSVTVNGKEYAWFGEDMAGTDNGFIEVIRGGTSIEADFDLTGNIVGH